MIDNPFATGTSIYVQAPTNSRWHNLVIDRRLSLLPWGKPRAAYHHQDPNTGITTAVLVYLDDETLDDDDRMAYLAPNSDRCPLCTGHGTITVREGTLPRNNKGEIIIPGEILDAILSGQTPEPMHDDVIDVSKPCPLCRSIDYAMQMDDELGCI
jgi:hypothetical protein